MLDREFRIRFTLADVIKTFLVSPVFVVLVYGLLCLPWDSPRASAWVQAFGSIAAIVAAGYFPIRHYEVMSRKRQTAMLQLLRVLAGQAAEAIWLLTNTTLDPEREVTQMREYLRCRRDLDFAPLMASLSQISVTDLPPERVRDLGVIRDAVQFSSDVAGSLSDWINAGSSHPEVLIVLRGKRDQVDIVSGRLPAIDNKEIQPRTAGQEKEKDFPQPSEPLMVMGYKVYYRFSYEAPLKEGFPQRAQLQIMYPADAKHPDVREVTANPKNGWADSIQAREGLRRQAQASITHMNMGR